MIFKEKDGNTVYIKTDLIRSAEIDWMAQKNEHKIFIVLHLDGYFRSLEFNDLLQAEKIIKEIETIMRCQND